MSSNDVRGSAQQPSSNPPSTSVAQAQSFHQQLLRKPEGNEAILAYQAGGLHGVLGGANFPASNSNPMQLPQQPRSYINMSHHNREESQNRSQGFDQQTLNPIQQAYLQYGFQSGSERSSQQMNNNIRSMQVQQSQQSNQVRANNNQMSMAAQMQAMQAMALERNIDLSLPENARLRAQLIPHLQSRMVAQSQQVTNEGSPQGNSSSDVSGQSGSANLRPTSNPSLINNQLPSRQPQLMGPKSSMNLNQGVNGPEISQMQYAKSINHSAVSSSEVAPQMRQNLGFTKQQTHVLKAQILAFRRLKKGDGTLPRELIEAITPPPLETQMQQVLLPVSQDNCSGKNTQTDISGHKDVKVEAFAGEEKPTSSTVNILGTTNVVVEPPPGFSSGKEEQPTAPVCAKIEPEKTPIQSENVVDMQVTKPVQVSNAPQAKDVVSSRKYHGPLFDSPFFTRKPDTFGSSMMMNNTSNLQIAYDVKELLYQEGKEVISKKRAENIEKIGGLLAVNLERKRISPDLVLKLQIEEKKLRLIDLQAHLRAAVDQQQQDIMAMPDRPYRKFIRLCARQRADLTRKVQASQRAARGKQLKSIFYWRKKFLESHWAIRDARTARNRGVAKYHEKMLREFSKNKDDDRSKRMEALKNNDVERYREMLLEQHTSIPGDAAARYNVLSSFLSQTEEYLQKLGGKITAAKNQQEIEEVANAAAAAARAQGLSEEEARAAATCAGEEVLIRNRFSEMNAPKDGSSVNKYYNLAHAVNERVLRQPSLLCAGSLREYQLVGLQWMLSLYNNKLNGILADEMGLGKTVQVMALIAYLMEFKGNNGPHLIIVPNAVLVNWKSELHKWLPSVSCIYYVGVKDQRAKLFSQEVLAKKFNVLVTTYEFIMFDRTKLSKIDWKYIVIDEAQRMKDRESVLARDLDRYRCQRRLLLTGTPLQNDLKELWSLLNLLLPEVFDNRKAFHDWFSKPFQKEDPARNAEDDWLEREKKVIVIHRLHQILEPFMLRRRVEDVEGSLPPKVSIILRCKMSAIQGAIYDWIKSTGTIRVDPDDDDRRMQKSSIYQTKKFKTLNNKCMELRKTCNHPLLNYPYFSDLSKDFLVRSCGKLFVLDRILVKLQRTGHRVLLFSTMTKLLDILEEYLQWRRLVYRRIDGTTSLDDRESAIMDFNSPGTDTFIFLLSIRAAGRGLNLQSADTVIIYDPDPNPKNEEQAVARAHRIGQTREVKVIYMEAVVDTIPSHQKEDEYTSGGRVDSEDDLAGKDRYMGSIEGLIRNNIQQYKIEMADEVINAGRFDQRTTHEERRLTLEAMLHDEERYQETLHDVPSLQEVNRLIARSEEEVEIFNEMDEEYDWVDEMTRYDQIPQWLRVSSKEVNATIGNRSNKQSKGGVSGGNVVVESGERQRGRGKGKKTPIYTLDDESGEFSESEEGQIGDLEDEEYCAAVEAAAAEKEESEEDVPVSADRYVYPRPPQSTKSTNIVEEANTSGSSSNSQKLMQVVSPSISSRKFGLLSALDSKQSSRSKRLPEEIEEGEIAMSGDSLMDVQQSDSGMHDHEEGEDQHVLQPKIKRKRSIRVRPRQHAADKFESQLKTDPEHKSLGEPIAYKNNQSDISLKIRQNLQSRKMSNTAKLSASPSGTSIGGSKMSEGIQKLCKHVISKFKRRIDKEGQQIVPLLTDLWKRNENSDYVSGSGKTLLDLRKIEQRVERFEYCGVMELVSDVQFMLKGALQCIGFSLEVRTEARKVHDLFFDILKISFPDIDFREARNAISFSRQPPPSASVPPQRQGETKSQKSPQNPMPRPQRETLLAHPGDLVICKKKRKEREKAGLKSGNMSSGSMSPLGRSIRSPQQHELPKTPLSWANPVKKTRTDVGKRRPSHL